MAILTGFTREEREELEARATALVKERGVECSCGGSRRDPGWHAEDCALEEAWDAYCDEVADEMPDEGPTDCAGLTPGPAVDAADVAWEPFEFTESPEGDRGREAPEGDWDR